MELTGAWRVFSPSSWIHIPDACSSAALDNPISTAFTGFSGLGTGIPRSASHGGCFLGDQSGPIPPLQVMNCRSLDAGQTSRESPVLPVAAGVPRSRSSGRRHKQTGHTCVGVIGEGLSGICFVSGDSGSTAEPESSNRRLNASFS
jgi:hypothetical protein